ncbi:MAG TPA: hypothetical protein VFP84_05085 [Kofleriaceae bacterium]|nr:hypothetical protein [Kofleriaceae bacterium]
MGSVMGSITRAGLCLAVAGCFYVDPINDEPQIQTVARVCAGPPCDQMFRDVHRGDTFQLAATFHDPDGSDADCHYHWTAVACRADQSKCDTGAVYDDGEPSPRITVPRTLAVTQEPVQLVRVTLELFDGRGAHATQVILVTVDDGPSLAVRETSRSHAVGGPIAVFATYGDPDGPTSNVHVTWQVTPPAGAPDPGYTLADLDVPADPGDPDHATVGKTLVPAVVGAGWDVAVTATDALGRATVAHATFDVAADAPPCIAQLEPIVPPAGAALAIHDPTRFAVPLVTDDLDPYPAVLGEPLLGTPTFAWSILRPGATAWQPLVGAVANNVEIDPAAFAPGDRVGVRVEIADRTRAPVACPADAATCGPPACTQRQTWQVEAR